MGRREVGSGSELNTTVTTTVSIGGGWGLGGSVQVWGRAPASMRDERRHVFCLGSGAYLDFSGGGGGLGLGSGAWHVSLQLGPTAWVATGMPDRVQNSPSSHL